MANKVYNKESEFQRDLWKSMKKKWYWIYKLPDTGYNLKPFDMFAVKNGVPYWIELKLFKKKPLETYEQIYKELRPNQIWWLYNIQQAGWQAKIVGYCNTQQKEIRFNFELLKDGNTREL